MAMNIWIRPVHDIQPVVFAGNIVPSRAFVEDLLKGNYPQENFLQQSSVRILQHPWHIFEYNDWAIREDFKLITEGRVSQPCLLRWCASTRKIFL